MFTLKKFFLLIGLIFIFGCAQAKDFNYGLKQITDLNSKYNTTMETYPQHINPINSMINDFKELKKLQLKTGQEPFNYIIDYRVLNLEAELLYIEGQKYGSGGTTKSGFGCKSRPFILESADLRNKSALKGFEAVDVLRELVNKHPQEAASAGLSEKNTLFLNATFYLVFNDARRDSNIINYFCPENVTLEIYQQEFRKETNLSKDFINNLTYQKAVIIHKEIMGVS